VVTATKDPDACLSWKATTPLSPRDELTEVISVSALILAGVEDGSADCDGGIQENWEEQKHQTGNQNLVFIRVLGSFALSRLKAALESLSHGPRRPADAYSGMIDK
jgi:hypothetical protein